MHEGEGIISCFVLYFFSLFEQHGVSRGLVPSCILYEDVLAAICSKKLANLMVGCGGGHILLGVHHWHLFVLS